MRHPSLLPLVLLVFAPVTQSLARPTDAVSPAIVSAEKLREVAFQAAREGDLPTLKAYFAAKQSVNEKNKRGDTLLTVACYSGKEPAVTLILSQPKVEVDARNAMGLTALSAAAYKGHAGVVKLLLKAKASVKAGNRSKQTPLMFAALFGRTEVAELLVRAGADVNARDRSGNTPLSLARDQGNDALVKRLEEVAKEVKK